METVKFQLTAVKLDIVVDIGYIIETILHITIYILPIIGWMIKFSRHHPEIKQEIGGRLLLDSSQLCSVDSPAVCQRGRNRSRHKGRKLVEVWFFFSPFHCDSLFYSH